MTTASRLKPLLRHLNVAALCATMGAAAHAAFVTPDQAGFHHCVIIYDSESRQADELLPHVAHLNRAAKPDQWLFDAFLYCPHTPGPSTKASYHTGPTNRADWEALLDGWFAEGHGFPALQAAVARARRTLGDPPRPVRAIITIPYPSAEQADFGDVTGDGTSEDLSTPEGREAVVQWYVAEALRRWADAKLTDLELWGFYWVNEGISANDAETVQHTARIVHERGYRLLWIPWFRAPGFRMWREFGLDVAILQPNYAFLSDHLGKVRSDRLIETATLAESLGMGVEMEVGYAPERDLREREIFREYLAFGGRYGYQSAATAYFQSLQVFPNLYHTKDPDARRVYDQLAAYIRGEPIDRPGALANAKVAVSQGLSRPVPPGRSPLLEEGGRGGKIAGPSTIVLRLPGRRPVGEAELNVTRGETPWTGLIAADLRSPNGDWRPAGWVRAVVPARDDDARTRYVVPVPIFAEAAKAFRLSVTPADPSVALDIDEITVTCGPPRLDWPELSLATGRPYTVEPDFPRRYPDRGGILADGEVSTEGWMQGRSVGWWGNEVEVQLDLGAVEPVERIVVHCDGGGHAEVRFPNAVVAELSTQEPPAPPNASGQGPAPPMPEVTVAASGSDVRVDGERAIEGDEPTAWGHYELSLATPTPARFISLYFPHRSWLMLSEVEIWSRGEDVARAAHYLFAPAPSPTEEAKYADDGHLLTDGFTAQSFVPARVAGWSRAEAIAVTLDLGGARQIREVVAHTLGGGLYGIVAPPSGQLQLSDDGLTFRIAASAQLTDPANSTSAHLPLTFRLPRRSGARFLRLRLTPSAGWTMLSEVSVR